MPYNYYTSNFGYLYGQNAYSNYVKLESKMTYAGFVQRFLDKLQHPEYAGAKARRVFFSVLSRYSSGMDASFYLSAPQLYGEVYHSDLKIPEALKWLKRNWIG